MDIDGLFETLVDDFVLNRLVFVNSGGHGYSELILDKSMALYGGNNAGKTSSLSASKIALYPEVDFKRCEKVFKFTSKGELFDFDTSYEHYFPTSQSFIVLEVTNPHGTFCMVCYKAGDYGYHRFFIPIAYNELRACFYRDDLKSPNPDLSIKQLANITDKHNGIAVSDAKELAELMFGSRLDIASKSRFCILPLVSAKNDAISAFRNIYQLAFESQKDDIYTLPEAIATLVEMRRSRDKEKLDANLSALVEEYQLLNAEHESLVHYQNNEGLFTDTQKQLSTCLDAYKTYSSAFNAVNTAFISDSEGHLHKLNDATEKVLRIQQELNRRNAELKSINKEYSSLLGGMKELKRTLLVDENAAHKARIILDSYGDVPEEDVIKWLKEDITKKASELETLKQADGAKMLLLKKSKEREQLVNMQRNLKEGIAQRQKTLLFQIPDDHARSVLHTLNTNLAHPLVALTDDDCQVIQEFTNLFSFDKSHNLAFRDVAIAGIKFTHFDADAQINRWETELEKIEDKIIVVEKESHELDKLIQQGNTADSLTEKQKWINDAKKEVELIQGLGFIIKRIDESKSGLEAKQIELDTFTIRKQEIENAQLEAKNKHNDAYWQQQQLQKRNHVHEQISVRLGAAKQAHLPDFDAKPDKEIPPEELSVDQAEQMLSLSSLFSRAFEELKSVYHDLELRVSHPDIDRDRRVSTLQEHQHCISIYSDKYAELSYLIRKHADATVTHNQRVNAVLNELREAQSALDLEIQSINQDLNSEKISNLSEIQLNITLKPAYLDIMNTLRKHDIQSESLLDETFYSTIAKFSAEFFDKRSGRLKLKDIINSVEFSFLNASTGIVETKGQSGGTNTTFMAFIISVLLSRITDANARLCMPIVVDEISTLDSKNTAAAIMQIVSHGFSIFCATPSFNSYVNRLIGKYLYIDRFHVEQPMAPKCNLRCLPEHIEDFGKKSTNDAEEDAIS